MESASLDHEIILISPRKVMNIPGAVHIQNFFRMFQYHLLSDIEYTFNLLDVRVLVDLRIRQIMRPKMDGGFQRRRHEHSHINTFVLSARIENLASLGDISQSLLLKLKEECFLSSMSVWS